MMKAKPEVKAMAEAKVEEAAETKAADFIALLGVKGGPAIRPGSNMPTSTLLSLGGVRILVDAGLGVARSVCGQGVGLTEIDTIFITHLHSDHYLELGGFIYTAWVSGRTRPIAVYGPARLGHYWRGFLQSMQDDIDLRIEDEGRVDIADLVVLHRLDEAVPIILGGATAVAMRNIHPPIEESFALRFDYGGGMAHAGGMGDGGGMAHVGGMAHAGGRVVLSGDTAYMPEMAGFARGADLLVHEAMLTEGVDAIMRDQTNGDERLRAHILRSHTTAADAGRIAHEAGVGRLVLNHFVPDGLAGFGEADWIDAVRQTWGGEVIIGQDGMRLVL